MLKVRTQLGRTLRYQAELGTERQLGHFDDAAADLMGPSGDQRYQEALSSRRAETTGSIPRNLRAKRDPATGSWVVSYADDGE